MNSYVGPLKQTIFQSSTSLQGVCTQVNFDLQESKKMSHSEQTEQASAARQVLEDAGREVTRLIFGDTHQQELLEMAEQLGTTTSTLFLILGLLLGAAAGYLFFLVVFWFIMPVVFFILLVLFLFFIYQVC